MKPWEVFHPFVLTEVIGCPLPTVDHHLRLAARDFCERTTAWREWSDPFQVEDACNRFVFDTDHQTELVRVIRATIQGDELRVLSPAALPPRWQNGADGPHDSLVPIDGEEYLIYPRPVLGAEVSLQLALKPSMTADFCGDVLYSEHAQAIAFGTLGRLLAIAGSSFVNPARALDCRQQYERAVHLAANTEFRMADPSQRRVTPAP